MPRVFSPRKFIMDFKIGMIRKFLEKYWPILLITIVVFAFHSRLFFPELSIYVTPDFGRSDILHSNLPLKLELSKDLKNFQLPILEDSIGHAYPLLAEGLIAPFYLPNLIIFGLLPFEVAIPLSYVTAFLLAAIGMYFLLKNLGFHDNSAVIGSMSYSFSASFILHVQHINYIQAAALIPLICLMYLKLLKTYELKYLVVLAFLISQQIFAGFIQITVYMIFALFILGITYIFLNKLSIRKFIVSAFFFITLSLGLSAIQLLPSYELIKSSTRTEGLSADYILSSFPLKPKNLLSLINPFINGKASNGTYNDPNFSKTGIFWENTSYIGFIPFLLALISLLELRKKKRNQFYIPILAVALTSVLLALGKYSPLHILFSFPPLNFFRVPARFLLLAQFAFAILSAFGLKIILENLRSNIKILVVSLIILISTVDIFWRWFYYNPIESFNSILKKPTLASKIVDSKDYRIYSLGQYEQWNSVFLDRGWENSEQDYIFFRNSLDQNLNMLYDIDQFAFFETLPTRRYLTLTGFINSGIKIGENSISLDDKSADLLGFYNVKYLTGTKPIDNSKYKQIANIEKNNKFYYLFEGKETKQIAEAFQNYKTVTFPSEYENVLKEADLKNTIILEGKPNVNFEPLSEKPILSLIEKKDGYYKFRTNSTSNFIFSLKTAYFPGWKASIDGEKTTIYPANIDSLAIILSEGNHLVEFSYESKSLKIGFLITIFSLITSLFAIKLNRQHL